MQQLQLLRCQRIEQHRHAGDVAAGVIEALCQAEPGRIDGKAKHDGNGRTRQPGGQRRRQPRRSDHVDLSRDEIRRKLRQSTVLAAAPAVQDREVLTFGQRLLGQPFAHPGNDAGLGPLVLAAEIANGSRRRSLRVQGRWPGDHATSKQGNEFAPLHSPRNVEGLLELSMTLPRGSGVGNLDRSGVVSAGSLTHDRSVSRHGEPILSCARRLTAAVLRSPG